MTESLTGMFKTIMPVTINYSGTHSNKTKLTGDPAGPAGPLEPSGPVSPY